MSNPTPDVPAPSPPAPRRVMFLSAAGLVGGAERSLYELLLAFPEGRVEPYACVPPEGNLARMFALAEVPVFPVSLRRFRRTLHPFVLAGQVKAVYRASRALKQLVDRHDIEIMHANTDSAALVAWEVSRDTGVPFVWHCRDLRPLGPLAKILAAKTTQAVAISEAVAEHLLSQGVDAGRLTTVVNGIDRARFHTAADRPAVRTRVRQYLGIDDDAPVLIDIGGWIPWKRHEYFLEALHAVRQKFPNARGLLVGSDLFKQNAGYAQMLEARADELELDEEHLLVLQQREDIPELLAAADVLVSPSDREPFGRVIAEAGASGLPVVATDSGAKKEIVADGQTGVLTPAGDAAAMGQACVELLSDDARRVTMGEAARARIAERFDIKRTANEVAALYDRIWEA